VIAESESCTDIPQRRAVGATVLGSFRRRYGSMPIVFRSSIGCALVLRRPLPTPAADSTRWSRYLPSACAAGCPANPLPRSRRDQMYKARGRIDRWRAFFDAEHRAHPRLSIHGERSGLSHQSIPSPRSIFFSVLSSHPDRSVRVASAKADPIQETNRQGAPTTHEPAASAARLCAAPPCAF